MIFRHLLALVLPVGVVSARELWFNNPAWDWASQSLPIGNGKHAGESWPSYVLQCDPGSFVKIFRVPIASFFGGIENDTWTLNVDSLWTGGPFQLAVHLS